MLSSVNTIWPPKNTAFGCLRKIRWAKSRTSLEMSVPMSVVWGGKTVRPEPDPRKQRVERKFVKYVGVTDVFGLAQEYPFQRNHQVP